MGQLGHQVIIAKFTAQGSLVAQTVWDSPLVFHSLVTKETNIGVDRDKNLYAHFEYADDSFVQHKPSYWVKFGPNLQVIWEKLIPWGDALTSVLPDGRSLVFISPKVQTFDANGVLLSEL